MNTCRAISKSSLQGVCCATLALILLLTGASVFAQSSAADWQQQVRESVKGHRLKPALETVERRLAQDDTDLEAHGWHARLLAWIPILDRLVSGQLEVPEHALKNALANTCRNCSRVLVGYLSQSTGKTRELIARTLGELAGPELESELLSLATDPLPEVRASAARALASARPPLALPALTRWRMIPNGSFAFAP